MKKHDEKTLRNIYYDPQTGFISFEKFYKKIKEQNLDYTKQEVKDFYESQEVNQVMKPIRKQKKFSSYMALYPSNIYQMDIIVYDRYEYNKYKYILVVIDIYSRYLQARPMTNRKLETIIKNYISIIKTMKPPDNIQTDNEFNKADFIDILDKTNTKFRFSHPDEINKNPIVERVNGTIANYLQKVRISTKRYDWNNYLYDIVDNYNNTYHSTIKDTPSNVFLKGKLNKQTYNIIENPLQVGDKVRIVNKKKIFDKGDVIKLSKEIYIVEKVTKTKAKINGLYYKPYELEKVENVDDFNDIKMPKTQTKENKTKQLYKRIDIDKNNIIDGKRERKKNSKYI